jgi:dTDP-4-amino-4,6-dideoxygalactose transaminase
MRIPILDLVPEIASRREAINEAIRKVVDSGHFILGENVREFETECASYLGVKHAISLASGTDALLIGLRALGIEPGDEIITSSFSFFATAEVISLLGAIPIFADIDPLTFNLDPYETAKKITSKTKAILPVHLFGQPADMKAFQILAREHGLLLLEDAAQAFGAEYQNKRVGSFGDAAAFSFFPTKNLGAFGDGGLLVTGSDSVAEKARILRVHGSRSRYHHEALGYASRLDEIQAAVLRVKLPWIDEMNAKRDRVASRYDEMLTSVPTLELPARADDRSHIFHQYTVRIKGRDRNDVQRRLAAREVDTMVYYPLPIHKLDVYRMSLTLPHVETAAEQVLSLPMWPDLTTEQQLRIGTELISVVTDQ